MIVSKQVPFATLYIILYIGQGESISKVLINNIQNKRRKTSRM